MLVVLMVELIMLFLGVFQYFSWVDKVIEISGVNNKYKQMVIWITLHNE